MNVVSVIATYSGCNKEEGGLLKGVKFHVHIDKHRETIPLILARH